MSFSFIDYLTAKKTVDDRALNRQVLQSLTDHLPAASATQPLHVLDVATGIGTMLERLTEWEILGNVVYTAIDLNPECIAAAKHRLPDWARRQGFQVQRETDQVFSLHRAGQKIRVVLEIANVFEFVARKRVKPHWDLIIAHAFFDLVDISALLSDLFSLLKPNGLYYFSINFDAETILIPEIDSALDRNIINLYHGAMADQHVNNVALSGPRAGRYLFQHLQAAQAQIINAGSSDWVIFSGPDGYYANEAFFLHCIIDSIGNMLESNSPPDLTEWLAQRHAQIEHGELVYIAHNLDFVGKVEG